MNPLKSNFLKIVFIYICILIFSIIGLRFVPVFTATKNGIILGLSIAVINGLSHWGSLSWAFHRSDKFFFIALYGGIFFKLLVLAGTFGYILYHPSYGIVGTLIPLVLMTALFTFVNLRFLPEKIKK